MNTPSVNILMATYNGSKHIVAQLDSLIAQTYENITIYIRDDGSSDDTVSIVQDYIAKNTSDKRIVLLDNGGVNLGCPTSFYELCRSCEAATYYAFCDQDDIWYPEKVQWAVELLQSKSKPSIPNVYISSCDYYTDKGEFIRSAPAQPDVLSLDLILYTTPASGFLIVFDEAARQDFILGVDPGYELHDRWLCRCAAAMGHIIVDHRKSAMHIRHSAAVTAEDSTNSNLIKAFINNELRGSAMTDIKAHLGYFLATFEEKLSPEQQLKLILFTKANSLPCQLRKLFYPRRLRIRLAGEIALRLQFLIWKI